MRRSRRTCIVTFSPLVKPVALVVDKSNDMQNNPSIASWKKGVIWVNWSKEVGLDELEIKTAAMENSDENGSGFRLLASYLSTVGAPSSAK